MQGLSASPEWNPRHPKWRDIEASYVAEFEWIATRSSQLNCAADAGGVDTLLQSYRSRLPEEEQSRLAQFYSAALGQKLLDANTEVAGLIQQAHTALSLEPESIPKRVKPLTAADQERWSQVVVLSDPFRLIGVALERRLAVNPDSFSSTTRIAYSLYGAQFEAIRARFSDSDLKEVRTFQESAEAKKEIALLADYVIISMTLLSQELDRRLRKLEDLKIQWRNSAGLR